MMDDKVNSADFRFYARLAVHGGVDNASPTVVILRSNTERIEFVVAEGDSRKELVERYVKEAVASVDENPLTDFAEYFEKIVHSVSEAINTSGFKVDRLPHADAEISLQFDMRSGQMVGRHKALHAFGTPPDNIGQRILSAIEKGFAGRVDALNKDLRQKLANNDHIGAAAAAVADNAAAIFSARAPELLDLICAVDQSKLNPALRLDLQKSLVSIASLQGREELVGSVAEDLLRDDPTLDEQTRFGLQNMVGVAAVQRGEVEHALSIWRELVRNKALKDAAQRGWIWRNISMAWGRRDAEALRAARHSVDAFLEAGDKRQAALSIRQLSSLQEASTPAHAIAQYDEMLALMSDTGLLDGEIRANIHHSKGQKLLEMRDAAGALVAAGEAAKLRRELLGVEEQLISSLHLAAIAAKQLGDDAEAAAFDGEAKQLEDKTQSSHFAFGRRAKALMEAFDPDEATALMAEAELQAESDLLAGIGVAIAISDPLLTPQQRIGRLEALLRKLDQRKAVKTLKQPARLAIAMLLRQQGERERAANWYRKLIEDHPLDLTLRELLIVTLWEVEDWGNAAIALRGELDAFGERSETLFAYGKSLFEAGDLSGAVNALSKALSLAQGNAELHALIRELRERALELGGTIIPARPQEASTGPVILDEVRLALREFAVFISGSKRMAFWQKEKNDKFHQWISRPENFGQTLLHTFLKARFGERVNVFEEIDVGAGRLDLFLQFFGGLSVIVELKMCGARYSSTYAKSGEGQIQHYMSNRGVHIGFLIVFDARMRDYTIPLLDGALQSQNSVTEIRVDVRPHVTPD